jgi:hypothetical protein
MSEVKRISQPPDVTVVVGSGRSKQRFECYSALLSAASPVLDAMLSSGMKEGMKRRIKFAKKDPEVWSLFLECIDPAGAFLAQRMDGWNYCDYYDLLKVETDYRDGEEAEASGEKSSILNRSNVRSLVPLFHELQMDKYLEKCDHIL